MSNIEELSGEELRLGTLRKMLIDVSTEDLITIVMERDDNTWKRVDCDGKLVGYINASARAIERIGSPGAAPDEQ